MKKTIQINVAGVVFYIEEDAYAKLNNYLKSIQAYFANYEGSQEIISDIEARVAEKFLEKDKIDNQNVVTQTDVDALIVSMGTVADFEALEEDGDFEAASGYIKADSEPVENTAAYTTPVGQPLPFGSDMPADNERKRIYRDTSRKALGGVLAGFAHYFNIDVTWVRIIFLLLALGASPLSDSGASAFFFIAYIVCWIAFPANANLVEDPKIKKFYRNPDGKVIAGVSSGLSAYFGVDIAVVRLIFVASVFFFGFGILAYIILWVSSPQAHTLTQKMEMKGEPVTLENIETNIKRNLNVPQKAPENVLTKILLFPFRLLAIIFSALGDLLKNLGPVVRILVGVFLLGMGIVLTFSVIAATAAYFGVTSNQAWLQTEAIGMIARDITPWAGFFGFLALFIPSITVALLGVSLLANRQIISRSFWLSGLGVWVIGIFGVVAAGATFSMNFARDATHEEIINYTMPTGILYLDAEDLTFDNGLQNNVEVDLESSPTNELRLEKTFSAAGPSRTEAMENAQKIIYKSEMRDSLLVFDARSTLPEDAKFREQRLRMRLFIPANRPFKISNNFAERVLNDDWNLRRKYGIDREDFDKFTFVMSADEGIVCQDCPVLSESEREELDRSQRDEESIDMYAFEEKRDGLPSKNFNADNFTEVDISNAFYVTIRQGSTHKVEVSAEREGDLNDVEVNISSGRLKIEFDDIFLSNREKVYVSITMPDLKELDMSGAIQAKVIGFDKGDKLTISMSGASKAAIDTEVNELDIDISGACKLDIRGKAREAKFDVSGASKVDAQNMIIDKADAEASGASKINLGKVNRLQSNASGASKISRQ